MLCAACQCNKPVAAFAESVAKHKACRQVRCKACQTCQRCQVELPVKSFEAAASTCRRCLSMAETMVCSACGLERSLSEYEAANLRAHTDARKATPLVCSDCRQQGCTPRCLERVECAECSRAYGIKSYNGTQWNNYMKQQLKRLVCNECATEISERLKRLHEDVKRSAFRCICKKPSHTERCPLYPRIFGEQLWPGKDGDVGLEDKQFLDHHRPAWWLVAQGRG